MKEVFIKDLRENENAEICLLVKEKIMLVDRNGKAYLSLKLMDKTGEIDGRVWEDAEELSRNFSKGEVVWVRGKVVTFMGKAQLKVIDLKKIDPKDVDFLDYLPQTMKDTEEMLKDLRGMIDGIDNPYLKTLLLLFLEDENIIKPFKKCPGGKQIHHAFLGGLLEHTHSVARLSIMIKGHYQGIDGDLLLAGSILHDIGKIRELTVNGYFDYTDEGRLLGHIYLGLEMVEERIRRIDGFPEELALQLKHMIISHHGDYIFGSPRRPKTVEALILHHLEDMDAKVRGLMDFLKTDQSRSSWTSYNHFFERFFYKGSSIERDDPPEKS